MGWHFLQYSESPLDPYPVPERGLVVVALALVCDQAGIRPGTGFEGPQLQDQLVWRR